MAGQHKTKEKRNFCPSIHTLSPAPALSFLFAVHDRHSVQVRAFFFAFFSPQQPMQLTTRRVNDHLLLSSGVVPCRLLHRRVCAIYASRVSNRAFTQIEPSPQTLVQILVTRRALHFGNASCPCLRAELPLLVTDLALRDLRDLTNFSRFLVPPSPPPKSVVDPSSSQPFRQVHTPNWG